MPTASPAASPLGFALGAPTGKAAAQSAPATAGTPFAQVLNDALEPPAPPTSSTPAAPTSPPTSDALTEPLDQGLLELNQELLKDELATEVIPLALPGSNASLTSKPQPPLPATGNVHAKLLAAAGETLDATPEPLLATTDKRSGDTTTNLAMPAASVRVLGPNTHVLNALLKHAKAITPLSDTPIASNEALSPRILAGMNMNVSTLLDSTASTPQTSAFTLIPQTALNTATASSPLTTSSLSSLMPGDFLLADAPNTQSSDFPDEMGTRLTWLAERRVGHAQIRVAPPELGAVDVRLQIDGDRVRLDFSSPHPEVRATLEASLPRLRELFEAQGMTLVQADVSQDPRGRHGEAGTFENLAAEMGEDGVSPSADESTVVTTRRQGLLDEYA